MFINGRSVYLIRHVTLEFHKLYKFDKHIQFLARLLNFNINMIGS